MQGGKAPTAAHLRLVIHYDPDTGMFTWKSRPLSMFKDRRCWRKWNTRYAGARAGYVDRGGYIRLAFKCYGVRAFSGHRAAWLLYYGEEPCADVDHINGVRHDNRIQNLRAATRKQNVRHSGMSSKNTTGYKGVTWDKAKRKFQVGICADGKRIFVGRYKSATEAAKAYDVAASKYHGEFAKTNQMLGLL